MGNLERFTQESMVRIKLGSCLSQPPYSPGNNNNNVPLGGMLGPNPITTKKWNWKWLKGMARIVSVV